MAAGVPAPGTVAPALAKSDIAAKIQRLPKERFRAATEISDWRPHDLRRTAATYMGRLGVSRTVIARVLNHVESGVTAVYDRSTGEPEIENALRVWGKRLDEIVHKAS